MPSSSQRLRDRFMVNGSDGIGECEEIVENAGGRIDQGWISGIDLATASDDLCDAVQFLIEEWDYALGGKRHATADDVAQQS